MTGTKVFIGTLVMLIAVTVIVLTLTQSPSSVQLPEPIARDVDSSPAVKTKDASSDPVLEQYRSPRPAPFEKVGEIVPLDIVVDQLAKRGLELHLPTRLPKGLQLIAVWTKVQDGEIGFPIIVLYSNVGDTAIATAELTIEIAPMPGIPFQVTNSTRHRLDKVGEWEAFISNKASVSHEEYYLKYRTQFAYLVDLQIGTLNYLYRFSPVMTGEEAMEVVASMKPVAVQKNP